MYALPLLAILPLALGAVVEKRQTTDLGGQVANYLAMAVKDVETLNTTLGQIAPNDPMVGLFPLLAIQAQNNQVNYDVGNATSNANMSTTFTQAESMNISTITMQLIPEVVSLLQNFVAHKGAFNNDGLNTTILNGLITQREATREQTNAIAAKLVAPYNAQTASAVALLASFDSAISVYMCPGTTGGCGVAATSVAASTTPISVAPATTSAVVATSAKPTSAAATSTAVVTQTTLAAAPGSTCPPAMTVTSTKMETAAAITSTVTSTVMETGAATTSTITITMDKSEPAMTITSTITSTEMKTEPAITVTSTKDITMTCPAAPGASTITVTSTEMKTETSTYTEMKTETYTESCTDGTMTITQQQQCTAAPSNGPKHHTAHGCWRWWGWDSSCNVNWQWETNN